MKTIKTRLFAVLLGMLIPMLTTNCGDKKTADKTETTETAEATAKTESIIQVASPPFQKFVVVTVAEEGLYKEADTNSPTLTKWVESDCESDICEMIYQWSDQPRKSGFEPSTDIIACEGVIFPVLGEEGEFYKVSTINHWCEIESAYIPKTSVGDIEWAPIKADMLETEDIGFKCRVMKDGKYKDVVFIDEYSDLEGETFHVGVLKDGFVATPLTYHMFSSLNNDQKDGIVIDDSEDEITLKFSKSQAMPVEYEDDAFRLDLTKLSDDQIAKIVDTVIKKKPEYVDCMYHFPAQGLQSFTYLSK